MVDIQLEKGVSESVVERELDESEGSDFSDFSSEDNDEWDEDKDTDHTLSRENSENKKGGSIFSLQRQQSTMSNFDRGSSKSYSENQCVRTDEFNHVRLRAHVRRLRQRGQLHDSIHFQR